MIDTAKTLFSAAALALLAGPVAGGGRAAEPTKGEVKLAKLLEGRVAGEPQRCLRTFPSRC